MCHILRQLGKYFVLKVSFLSFLLSLRHFFWWNWNPIRRTVQIFNHRFTLGLNSFKFLNRQGIMLIDSFSPLRILLAILLPTCSPDFARSIQNAVNLLTFWYDEVLQDKLPLIHIGDCVRYDQWNGDVSSVGRLLGIFQTLLCRIYEHPTKHWDKILAKRSYFHLITYLATFFILGLLLGGEIHLYKRNKLLRLIW